MIKTYVQNDIYSPTSYKISYGSLRTTRILFYETFSSPYFHYVWPPRSLICWEHRSTGQKRGECSSWLDIVMTIQSSSICLWTDLKNVLKDHKQQLKVKNSLRLKTMCLSILNNKSLNCLRGNIVMRGFSQNL